MFSPRSAARVAASSVSSEDASPVLAAQIAAEYESLRGPDACPRSMFMMPSPESLLRWHGVLFVHHGPYEGSVVRFTILFTSGFPRVAPVIRLDSDVFHPLVDPKTRIWKPKGQLASWTPGTDHVVHLLRDIKDSFKAQYLAGIMEDEAANKQIWSLYHHSHQTFLSMTAQRARHSTSRDVLFPPAEMEMDSRAGVLASPHKGTPKTLRKMSSYGSFKVDEPGPIVFRDISEEEHTILLERLKAGAIK